MAKEPDDKWLSENETALLCAIKSLAQLIVDKGISTAEEVDGVILRERDRFANRSLPQGAAVLEILVQQRQRDDRSPSELSSLIRDLPKGRA
jgi:hypothetical protein